MCLEVHLLCSSPFCQVDSVDRQSHWAGAERSLACGGGQLKPHNNASLESRPSQGPSVQVQEPPCRRPRAQVGMAATTVARARSLHWQIKGTQRVKEPCEEVVLQELQGQEAVFHSEAGALAGVL